MQLSSRLSQPNQPEDFLLQTEPMQLKAEMCFIKNGEQNVAADSVLRSFNRTSFLCYWCNFACIDTHNFTAKLLRRVTSYKIHNLGNTQEFKYMYMFKMPFY